MEDSLLELKQQSVPFRFVCAWVNRDFLGISVFCAESHPRLNQDNNLLSFTQFQPEVILLLRYPLPSLAVRPSINNTISIVLSQEVQVPLPFVAVAAMTFDESQLPPRMSPYFITPFHEVPRCCFLPLQISQRGVSESDKEKTI